MLSQIDCASKRLSDRRFRQPIAMTNPFASAVRITAPLRNYDYAIGFSTALPPIQEPKKLLSKMFRRAQSTLIHNLSSFLEHATHDPASTVYRGTLFEWQTHDALERLGMQLRRVGGKSDGGIDLRGTWPHFNINILVQCKNTKLGTTPDSVRSLIGASARHGESIAILSTSSTKRYTPDVISHFMDSRLPLALARVIDDQTESLLFNPAAERRLDGLSVVTQFNEKGDPALVLMHHGRILECI